MKAFDDGEGGEVLTAHYDTDGGVRLVTDLRGDALAALCGNCDGRKCMSCVFREVHDNCEDSCPSCCPPPPSLVEAPPTPRRQALTEAADLIDNDRNAQYGEPSVNLGNTRDIFQVLFPERQWTAADVARAMVAVKLARSVHQYKRDTGVDLLGWAAIYVELEET